MGCFTPFGCAVVVIGIIIGVILTVYPHSPFRPSTLPNPFAQPTPAHHSKPSVRVLSLNLEPEQDVRGTPTLSSDFVNHVLAAAHSPAQGTGQALYELSRQYGIDDAYALAFFAHESQFGTTGMAQLTHSFGNIRCSTGYQCINGYRAYSSWVASEQDWYQLIRTLYINTWHLTTVEQIVPVYAPMSDGNDVPGYIAEVLQAVAHWQRGDVGAWQHVRTANRCKLCRFLMYCPAFWCCIVPWESWFTSPASKTRRASCGCNGSRTMNSRSCFLSLTGILIIVRWK